MTFRFTTAGESHGRGLAAILEGIPAGLPITAERVTADKALEWGIVNHVFPHEQLMEHVMEWANRLAAGPTLAYGLAKRAMNRAWDTSLEDALEYEAHMQELAARSHDFREGVTAFLEKREASFIGE